MKGYFRKRGNKWSFTIDIGIDPRTGKRLQKTMSGFSTKKEAQVAAAKMQVECSDNTFVNEQNIMLVDFVDDWMRMYEKTGVKESTLRVRKHETGHLKKAFKYIKLKDITRKMYQEFINDLSDKLAQNTVSGINLTGKMVFKKAVEYKIIKDDPSQYAKLPRIRKTVEELEKEEEIPKYLEKEDLALFLNTAKEKGLINDYIIFKVLSYTGLRAGELCALKWKDINFKENTISITKTYYNPNNVTTGYKLLTPKTKKSKRTIIIDSILSQELKSHKKTYLKVQLKNTNFYDGNFVFGRLSGKYLGYPIFIKTIEDHMTRLLKLAKLDSKLTPHSLRHTHTSLLAEAGVGLEEIMDRLGHQDSDTTRNVYMHVTQSKKKEAAQKFSELMNSF